MCFTAGVTQRLSFTHHLLAGSPPPILTSKDSSASAASQIETQTTMMSTDLTTEDGMLVYLRQGHFPKCSGTKQLTGGWGGFVYRATTGDPETSFVVVKHAEGYAARTPEWKLDVNRMVCYLVQG